MTEHRVSIPRLRSVKFKDGRGELRVLRPVAKAESEVYRRMRRDFASMLARIPADKVAGFALVAWTDDGWAWPRLQIDGGPVPRHLAPAYLHDVMLGEVVLNDIEDSLGMAPPRKPDDPA